MSGARSTVIVGGKKVEKYYEDDNRGIMRCKKIIKKLTDWDLDSDPPPFSGELEGVSVDELRKLAG